MSGYQEVLTDPSYRGQIVAMTAPADRQLRRERSRR
ncbi:MAG: carbamoyl-phosphate synthase domain-containing protein [Chthoniobacter sp.]